MLESQIRLDDFHRLLSQDRRPAPVHLTFHASWQGSVPSLTDRYTVVDLLGKSFQPDHSL